MAIKYLDAKRIRGSSTADSAAYSTTFGATTGWRTNQTHVFIDTANNMLEFELDDDNTDEYLNYDLGAGNVSNDSWILRYELVFSTLNLSSNDVNNALIVGIMDNATPSGLVSSGDAITYNTQITNTTIGNVLSCVNGGSQSKADVNNDPFSSSTATGTTFYVEIKRVSATSTEQRVYSTSDYSTTQVGTTMTRSTSSAVTALRYLTVQVQNGAFGGSGYTGYIKNLKFYNGTTTTTDEKATLITTFSDSLGTSADGTLVGDPAQDTTPTPPTGLGTSSFYFDGNDAIDIDGALSFSTTVGSISLWFYNDGTSNEKAVLFFGDTDAGSYLGIETRTDGMMVKFRQASGTTTQWEIRACPSCNNNITLDDDWHHLVLSQDGTAVKVYVDNVLLTTFDGETDKSKWVESNLDNGRIGCNSISGNGNANFFTGNLMEIGLWNVALTSTQVASIYGNGGSTAKKANTEPVGLRAYYPLSGTTVTNELADYSDLPENTLFEETDTYKIYWLQSDNTWKSVNDLAFAAGVFAGGSNGSYENVIEYIDIATLGNGTDFGDLTTARKGLAGCSNGTRGVFGTGYLGSNTNVIDYITLALKGNATDFGDITMQRRYLGSCASTTRGVWAGGYGNSGNTNTMDYVTIATTGDATDFGNLLQATTGVAGCSNGTRGCWRKSGTTDIEYITIASAGNASDFGNGNVTVSYIVCGLADATRGVFAGGSSSDHMDYITIASTGNATDFGNLTASGDGLAGIANTTRGCIGGTGGTGSSGGKIDYITIQTTGNAADFGDLTKGKEYFGGCSSVASGT